MWGAPPPTPAKSRPQRLPPEGPACSELLFIFLIFFIAPVNKMPGSFLTGARSIDPAPVKKIPGIFFTGARSNWFTETCCPGRIQIFNFPLHRLGKFPGILFTGAGSNDPAPNGFVLLHLQKTINKYINSKKKSVLGRLDKNDQKWSKNDPFLGHCFSQKIIFSGKKKKFTFLRGTKFVPPSPRQKRASDKVAKRKMT